MALKLTGVLNWHPGYTSVFMLHVHLTCGFQTWGNGKIDPTKASNANSSLGFFPINLKLATTARQNQCVIK